MKSTEEIKIPPFKSKTAEGAYLSMIDDAKKEYALMLKEIPTSKDVLQYMHLRWMAIEKFLEFKRLALEVACKIDSNQRMMAASIVHVTRDQP